MTTDWSGRPIEASRALDSMPDYAVRMNGTILVAPSVFEELRRAAPEQLRSMLMRLRLVDVPSIDESMRGMWMEDFEARMFARRVPA